MSNTHQDPVVGRTTASSTQNTLFTSADSTPAKKKFGSNLAYTCAPPDYESAREQLSDEMEGRWVGAMPVKEFLDTFLHSADAPLPKIPENSFKGVKENGPDSARYAPFIDAIQQWMPHLQAMNTSNREDTSNKLKLKTDISIYKRDEPVPDRTNFSQMELWVEFKSNDGVAFQDPPETTEESRQAAIKSGSFTPATKEGRLIRGQLSHYAGALHSVQFRNFSFSILVEAHNARFLRWDPSGVVVTAAFNYRTQPSLMAEFLWRFDHLSPMERGHDPTVQPADLVREVAERVRQKLGINDTALYRYELPGKAELGYAYGPRPSTQNRSLVSRCTRNLPVVWIPVQEDVTRKKEPWYQEWTIYMKDTWRFLSSSPDVIVMPEHKIYEILHSHNIPNIPDHVAGGDIDGGKTRTQDFVNALWVCVQPRISPYQHYRLFHVVVGRALYKFDCTKQLVTGIFDALQAHSYAFTKAKILHRDISAGNIILTDDGRGLLIDWELAKFLDDIGSRRPDRTGTWQFMSAKLLLNPSKMHEFTDDLESFLHVLAWITPNTYTAGFRDDDLLKFDEVISKEGCFERGGLRKAHALGLGVYPSEKFQPRISTPLLKLLEALSLPFKSLYEKPPSDEDRKKVVIPQEIPDYDFVLLCAGISKYDKNIESLKTAKLFLEKMSHALDEAWPTDDKADPNLPGSFSKTKNTQVKTTLHETGRLVNSEEVSSRGSKRAASPIPESAKRRRYTPVTSEAHP